MRNVHPPQFIMMDMSPERKLLVGRAVRSREWEISVDVAPQPLLKRPFAIQRAYHRHFDNDYLKRLRLPPSLAPFLHTVYPYQFDMMYKVLPDGIGTPMMTKLKQGDKIHMLGPLGRRFDVRQLRQQGVNEVHVIGGGVGMAPLILFVQSLKFYGFSVKAFIGINKLETLRYRGDVDKSFAEDPRDAYIYIDDLLEAGLSSEDIHLSFDTEAPKSAVREIPKKNIFSGLITEQYQKFVGGRSKESVMAFACGPNIMMEIILGIAREAGIPLKVLMEKRMGCGFGVCLSCVCKVRSADGGEDYARVCTEGPLFDAEEIIWKENDSKQQSASSSCAVRC